MSWCVHVCHVRGGSRFVFQTNCLFTLDGKDGVDFNWLWISKGGLGRGGGGWGGGGVGLGWGLPPEYRLLIHL